MLSLQDTEQGLRIVRQRHQNCFLAVAGWSAGGGWVRRYCSFSGTANLADAAFCLDGGYGWEFTVRTVDQHNPAIAKIMGTSLAKPLLEKASRCPDQVPKWLDVPRLRDAQRESWAAVMKAAHAAHGGFSDLDDYFKAVPDKTMLLKQDSHVPLLIMGSSSEGAAPHSYWTELDPIARLPESCPNIFVCMQWLGPHIHRPSGLFGTGNWAAELCLQFFEAIRCESK